MYYVHHSMIFYNGIMRANMILLERRYWVAMSFSRATPLAKRVFQKYKKMSLAVRV